MLAPLGATAIRLCRYGILPREALERARLVTNAAVVGRLVRDFNRLPAFPPGPVPSCPADFGSGVDALLAYPAWRRVTIGVGLTGCNGATNGTLARWALPGANGKELLGELLRLTR
jgi:hypothetical protein